MPEIKKILVYWPYFQHYHLARLQSLKLLCEANGIQLVAIALSRQSTDLHESVQCSAGHPNCVFEIEFNQLIKLTNGQIKEIAE